MNMKDGGLFDNIGMLMLICVLTFIFNNDEYYVKCEKLISDLLSNFSLFQPKYNVLILEGKRCMKVTSYMTKTDSLFSISESLEHPYEAIIKKEKLWKYVLEKSKKFFRRQDFDIKTHFINGAIYIASKKLISQKKIFTNSNHSFYEMPKNKSLEINDREEAYIIDSILKRRNK